MNRFAFLWAPLLVLVLTGSLYAPPAHAQDTGTIAGVVVDGANGETLPGANVSIKGTTTGTATDLNGRYRLTGLEPGTYDVVASFIGFAPKTVTGVEVEAGETTTVDFTLQQQTAELEEVIVEAEVARDSEAGLLKRRAKAAAVSDAISAEAIGRAAASSAADAMEKVTGASITDGKYVNVRGLGGRYVNTQLNGAELPSSDPDKNAVPLDIFPSGLLDNIVTSKTFTPDRPGNFTGGSINLSTQSFPSDLAVSVSASTTYNSEVEYGDILTAGGGLDEVPAAAQRGVPAPTTNDPGQQQRLDEITRSFTPDMTPRFDQAPINQSYSISFGNGYEIGDDQKIGVVAGGTYGKTVQAANDGFSGQYVLNGDVNSTDALFPDFELGAQSGSVEDTYGGLLGVSYSPGSNNELSFNALVNRSEQSSARSQRGAFPRDLGEGEIFVSRSLETVERTLYSLQLQGDHLVLSDSPRLRVDWQAAYTNTQQNEPDVRFFNNDIDPAGSDSTFNISPAIYPQPTRYFRDLSEFSLSNDLNFTLGLGDTEIKFGGRYLIKDRTLDEARFIHATTGNVLFDDTNGDPQAYFGDQAGIIGETNGRPVFGTYISDLTQASNNFDAQRTVGAGYAMIDAPILVEGLRLIAGARVEYTDQSVENAVQRDEIVVTDLLPSANLVYSVSDNMNVRVAYGRTIARPSFREFAPFNFFDFINNEITNGNGDLNRTTVNNFDVRWEWFTRPGEIFAVSGFLKDFTDPIERTLEPQAVNREVTFENQESAIVFGTEVEARKRLDFISPALQYFEVGGNFTLTHSAVSISDSELQQIQEKVPNADDTRPLQGQSPFLANLDISYNNPETGTTLSAFYNYFADRLDTIERAGTPNQFEDGRHTIDATASQQIYGGFSAKLAVKNILNEEFRLIQTYKGRDYENNVYQLGRTISLSFTYDL